MYTFCKSERKKGVGTILIGFGLLMIGMDNMSSAMAPLEHEAWFLQLFAHLSNPILGVLAGALLTTVMQSSSASVGVLQGPQRHWGHYLRQCSAYDYGGKISALVPPRCYPP